MKYIIHIDMDAFFASIEQLTYPSLRGRPIVVGGKPGTRSVVTSASYEARKYGIKSGMPISQALRLCPHCVVVPGKLEKYAVYATKIYRIIESFPVNLEVYSIDEVFVEYNGKSPVSLVRDIKQALMQDIGITCSVGISINKLVAKMLSSTSKPAGLSIMTSYSEIKRFFGGLELQEIWGIGRKTAQKLYTMFRARYAKDLWPVSQATLQAVFGKYGSFLYYAVRGIYDSAVIPFYEMHREKSIGHSRTFSEDILDKNQILAYLMLMSEKVGYRLRQMEAATRAVNLTLRTSNFKTHIFHKTIDRYICLDSDIFQYGRELLEERWKFDEPLRLIGISVSSIVYKHRPTQLLLFSKKPDGSEEALGRAIDNIRRDFGHNAIQWASTLSIKRPLSAYSSFSKIKNF